METKINKEEGIVFRGKAKELKPFLDDLKRRYGKDAILQEVLNDFSS